MNIRRFFSRRRRDAELAREIEAHLAMEADDNMARGMSLEQARRQAHLRFGSPRRVRESEWEGNTMKFVDDCWRDLKYAVRTLARTPGFTISAVLVMALGIGADSALFTVVRSVLLKPLPFKDPGRLIQLYEVSPDGKRPYNFVAGGMYAAWKQQAPSVEQMAIYGTDSISLSGDGGPLPERIRYAQCEWNLFSMLGVEPELGRWFGEKDDRSQAAGTVMLTHSLWMRRYAGDRAILGKTILLDARPYSVIGVLPAWFNYPDQTVQLWATIYHEKSPAEMQQTNSHNFFVLARLKPGSTMAQARAEVDTAEKRVHMSSPESIGGECSDRAHNAGWVGARCQDATLRAAGRHQLRVADCMPECGKPAGSTGGVKTQGDLNQSGAGRQPIAPDARTGDGERDSCRAWRSAGLAAGMGGCPVAGADAARHGARQYDSDGCGLDSIRAWHHGFERRDGRAYPGAVVVSQSTP